MSNTKYDFKEEVNKIILDVAGHSQSKYTYGELRRITIRMAALIINEISGKDIITEDIIKEVDDSKLSKLEDTYPLHVDLDEVELFINPDIYTILKEHGVCNIIPETGYYQYIDSIKECTECDDLTICILHVIMSVFGV